MSLSRWTAGLVGDRDPAQPLLTLLDGPARVELSGATTANWVAKNANLLVDGLGGPARVGVHLPLHWQSVAVVLAGVAAGAEVVLAPGPEGLSGCDAAFTDVGHAEAALDAGVDEVLAVSLHPLGAPLPSVPPLVVDHAREVPSYGDHWPGSAQVGAVLVGGTPLELPDLPVGPEDRVAVADLATALAVLRTGAAAVLLPGGAPDGAALAAERVTASAGPDLEGVPALDLPRP